MNEMHTPWKDAEGRFNVLVQRQDFESVRVVHARAQRWIAFQGVRDDQWPNVPVELFDIPEEGVYHFREEES